MGIIWLGSGGVCLNINRNRPRSFEVRLYVWDDDLCFFPFGADDLGPEIGSGDESPAPVSADRRETGKIGSSSG